MSQYQISNNLQSDGEDLVVELLRLAKQDVSGNYLALAGGTMSGAIDMAFNKIVDLGTPSSNTDAVNKLYVDTHSGGNYLEKTGGILTGDLTINRTGSNGVKTPLNIIDTTSGLSPSLNYTYNNVNATDNYSNLNINSVRQYGGGVNLNMNNTEGSFFNIKSFFSDINLYRTTLTHRGETQNQDIVITMRDNIIDFSNELQMSSNKISELANGTAGTDAVNLNQLNGVSNTKLSLNGSTPMTGNFNMNGLRITNLQAGTISTNAVNVAQLNGKLSLDGSNFMFGNLNVNNNKITFLSPATTGSDAVNKNQLDDGLAQLDNALNNKLSLNGGTMSGGINMNNNNLRMSSTTGVNSAQIQFPNDNRILTLSNSDMVMYRGNDHYIAVGNAGPYVGSRLNMQTNKIIGLSNGTAGTDAINLNQLNTGINSRLSTAGGLLTGGLNMNGNKISSLGIPTNDADAATKKYVDDNAGVGTFRYVNKSFNALQFLDGGQTTLEIDFESIIPDGNYSFDISIYSKYNPDGIAADGFTFMTRPITNNAPFPFFLKSPLTMHHAFITPNNETYGTTNLKWTDIRTSSTNNTSFRVLFQYNGGTAWNFDINFRGVVTKIG